MIAKTVFSFAAGRKAGVIQTLSLVPLPIAIWPGGGVACHLSLGERRHPLGLIYAIYSENPAHSCLLSKYICDLFMGNQWFQGLSAQQCDGE